MTDDLTQRMAQLIVENTVLTAQVAALKKEKRDLEHLRILNQAEIMNLRRMVGVLMGE